MMSKTVEVLDWRPFFQEERLATNVQEVIQYKRKNVYKTIIRVGVLTLTLLTALPLSADLVSAATTLAEAANDSEVGGTWDKLVGGLVKLLDPVAKVFGIIAGIAIMTGNGKIGLERLFWLSLGYLTARKVEAWIGFLNGL